MDSASETTRSCNRRLQEISILRGHLAGADRVQEDVSSNSSPATLDQRRYHIARAVTFFDDEVGKRDRVPGSTDRRQHRGKDLVSVEEQLRAVAVDATRQRVGFECSLERRLANVHIRRDIVRMAQRAPGQEDTTEEGDDLSRT